jgi:hypothetical protein
MVNILHLLKSFGMVEQTDAFFTSDADFIALTENDSYKALVSKHALFNEALKSIFAKEKK